jgi:hypothetical protein
MLQLRVQRGLLTPLYPGVFRATAVPTTFAQKIYAACSWAGPNALASHRAAAKIWHLGAERQHIIEVTLDRRAPKPARGVTFHKTDVMPSCDRRVRDSIAVTDATRTTIDCCSALPALRAEAVMDDALHERLTSIDRLDRRIDALSARGRNGIAQARRLLDKRIREDERPESRLTRRLLSLIQSSTLPNPVSLHEIRLPDGRTLHPDLAYPDLFIAIEADSYRHHTDDFAWRLDRRRDNALQPLGWIVLRFTWDDVINKPDYVIGVIASALRQRGLLI